MGGNSMKKTLLAFALISILVLTGCTTNEANIAETTADSFNETPVITEEVIEESQITPVISSSESEATSQAELSVDEVTSESSSSESSEEINEEEITLVEEVTHDDSLELDIVPIPEGLYTNYELEGQLIEDERIDSAINAVVTYLKENNHYFDSAEYYFKIVQLANDDLIELTIAEQYSDGEIIRGVFDYNLVERSIEKVHK